MSEKDLEQQAIIMAAHTMGKDLLALVLQEIRTMPKVWTMLSESDQAAIMDRIKMRIRAIAEVTVSILSDEGCLSVLADIDGVAFKEGDIKATFKVNRGNDSESLMALSTSCGQACRIVLTGAARFTEGMDAIKPEKDQKELDLNPPAVGDELLTEALELVVNLGRVSVSEIQTELGVSYARAARMVDLMQNEGSISKADDAGNRTIATTEELEAIGYVVTVSENATLLSKPSPDETEPETSPENFELTGEASDIPEELDPDDIERELDDTDEGTRHVVDPDDAEDEEGEDNAVPVLNAKKPKPLAAISMEKEAKAKARKKH